MTFLELEQENKRLKELLQQALDSGVNSAWSKEVNDILNPPKAENKFGGNQKWDGEACNSCNHSSNSHAGGGTKHCSVVDCPCMKFEPSGRANQSGR